MNLAVILSVILSLGILAATIKTLKGIKFDVRRISRIGVVAAITIVLYMIKIVPFPQGGGCSLLSILPIMILAVMFDTQEALVCAIIVAFIKIVIQPPYYPMQIPLDYLGAMISVAFTPMFGTDKKSKLVTGALVASLLSIIFSVLSGIIFFGEFAPKGTSVWIYSIVYNFLGYGVEALLSVIALSLLPLKHLKTTIKGKKVI